MLKVLLIDDEYLILKGVEAMLKHQDMFPVEIIPYMDSVEALSAILDLQPDVVVLDINMPELDGLSFIEKALATGYAGKFIIISGYEDNAYLKRALELHVTDYLIKPISKQKLLSTLLSLNDQKSERQHILLDRLRNKLLLSSDFHNTHTDWSRLFPRAFYRMFFLRAAVSQEQMHEWMISLSNYFMPVYPIWFDFGFAFVCGMPQIFQDREVTEVCKACGISADQMPGLSETMDQPGLLMLLSQKDKLLMLLDAVSDSIFRELGFQRDEKPKHASLDIARLIIVNAASEEIAAAYKFFFRNCSDLQKTFDWAFVEGVTGGLIRNNYTLQPFQLSRFYSMVRRDISCSLSPEMIMMDLPRYYVHTLKRPESAVQNYSPKIEEALSFIGDRFSEDISLNDVAESVGLSPSYFSSVFSREVGMPFVSYIKKARLDEACRLMETNPSLSVETIAGNVGYQTLGQFYKVFKAEYNMTPKKWQEQRQKE